MKEWHPGVKRMALEVPDAGLILNAAGVHAALLRYYGQLTQRLYMSLDYYNASILCVCVCAHASVCMCVTISYVTIIGTKALGDAYMLGALCDFL